MTLLELHDLLQGCIPDIEESEEQKKFPQEKRRIQNTLSYHNSRDDDKPPKAKRPCHEIGPGPSRRLQEKLVPLSNEP